MSKDHDMTIHKIIKANNHIKHVQYSSQNKEIMTKIRYRFLFAFQIGEDFKHIQGFQEFCL